MTKQGKKLKICVLAHIFQKVQIDPIFYEKSPVFFIDSTFFHGKTENDVKKCINLKGWGEIDLQKFSMGKVIVIKFYKVFC